MELWNFAKYYSVKSTSSDPGIKKISRTCTYKSIAEYKYRINFIYKYFSCQNNYDRPLFLKMFYRILRFHSSPMFRN